MNLTANGQGLPPASAALALCIDLDVPPSDDLVLDAFHEVIADVRRLREQALLSTRINNEFFKDCEQNTLCLHVIRHALPCLPDAQQDLLQSQLEISAGWLASVKPSA